jgi:threonine/homoserine/homoserine lactone efflux protein
MSWLGHIQRHSKPQHGYSSLMDAPTLLSFSLFAFVAAFTPGPNNVMLAAAGANFGFRASLPHIFGVFTGFTILVVVAGFGLASLFTALPALYNILKIISILFLLYLAWRVATAGRDKTRHNDRPLRFWQAAMFQLVNPKGITVIISSVTAYTSSAANLANEVLVIFIVLALVTFAATCTWTLFGILIGQFLKTETQLRLFNILMASLLLASLLPILFGWKPT